MSSLLVLPGILPKAQQNLVNMADCYAFLLTNHDPTHSGDFLIWIKFITVLKKYSLVNSIFFFSGKRAVFLIDCLFIIVTNIYLLC